MRFNKIINSVLKEEIPSREARAQAMQSLSEPSPVFNFTYVSWDWKEREPHEDVTRLSDSGLFPFQYETSLGTDSYFIFFSDIRLSEKDCGELSLVPAYIEELENANILRYNDKEDYYTCYVSLEELFVAIRELE